MTTTTEAERAWRLKGDYHRKVADTDHGRAMTAAAATYAETGELPMSWLHIKADTDPALLTLRADRLAAALTSWRQALHETDCRECGIGSNLLGKEVTQVEADLPWLVFSAKRGTRPSASLVAPPPAPEEVGAVLARAGGRRRDGVLHVYVDPRWYRTWQAWALGARKAYDRRSSQESRNVELEHAFECYEHGVSRVRKEGGNRCACPPGMEHLAPYTSCTSLHTTPRKWYEQHGLLVARCPGGPGAPTLPTPIVPDGIVARIVQEDEALLAQLAGVDVEDQGAVADPDPLGLTREIVELRTQLAHARGKADEAETLAHRLGKELQEANASLNLREGVLVLPLETVVDILTESLALPTGGKIVGVISSPGDRSVHFHVVGTAQTMPLVDERPPGADLVPLSRKWRSVDGVPIVNEYDGRSGGYPWRPMPWSEQ